MARHAVPASTVEKWTMVQAIQASPDALPIVIGAGGVDTRNVCDGIRRLDRLDLAGYLVPPPTTSGRRLKASPGITTRSPGLPTDL